MANLELKLKDKVEFELEKGDFILLNGLSIGDKLYVVAINKDKKIVLVSVKTGSFWNSDGDTRDCVSSLIDAYGGKVIKSNKIKITVEEI